MLRKVLLALFVLLLVAGGLAGVKAMQIRSLMASGASFKVPPERITSTEVRQEHWESKLSAVGSVSAVQGVLIRTEVSGVVQRLVFDSGAVARKGQLLVELDSSSEQAQLRSAQARIELAKANLARAQDMRRQDLIAQSDFDTAEATFKTSSADVDSIRVAIAKKSIRAPFTGRLGIRQVQLGQYLDVAAPVVSLQSLGPVYVDFSLPEQQVVGVRPGMLVRATVDSNPGKIFEGRLSAISPEVDVASRNVRLQATFADRDGLLTPGMFARVDLILTEVTSPLVVPVTAVLDAPYGASVFVIENVRDEKTGASSQQVRMTTVRLGETRGDLVVVEQGLTAGQRIASSGVFKLRDRTEVVISDELAPTAEASPRPADS